MMYFCFSNLKNLKMKKLILLLFIIGTIGFVSCTDDPAPESKKYTSVLDGETIVVNRCYYKTMNNSLGSFLITKGYKTINYSKGKYDETIFVLDTDTTRHITGQIISENDSLIIFKKKQ
jgi:hypothetical protein